MWNCKILYTVFFFYLLSFIVLGDRYNPNLSEKESFFKEWQEVDLSEITITGAKRISQTLIQADCEDVYEQEALNVPVVYTFKINSGYFGLKYIFDIHFRKSQSILFTFDENSVQLVSSDQTSISYPSQKSSCTNNGIEEIFVQNYIVGSSLENQELVQIQFNNLDSQFFISHFKAFKQECQKNCAFCQSNLCTKCQTGYTKILSECNCSGAFYNAQCVEKCPEGTFLGKNKECMEYLNKSQIFQDIEGEFYEYVPDYNTTQRERNIQINGIKTAGSFIQNEQAHYIIEKELTEKTDLGIQFVLYFLGNIDAYTYIHLFVNDYEVSKIQKQRFLIQHLSGMLVQNQCYFGDNIQCQSYNVSIQVEEIESLSSIKIKGRFSLADSSQAWAFSDLKIFSLQWAPFKCQGKMYENKCIPSCPPYTSEENSQCIDLAWQYQFSQYISKHFYNLNNEFENYAQEDVKFTEDFKCFNKYHPYFFQNRYIFGGKNCWSQGSMTMKLKIINPHYKVRLYVKALLIDFQQNDSFQITLDQVREKFSAQRGSHPLNIQVGDHEMQDYGVDVNQDQFEVSNSLYQLQVKFTCNSEKSAFCAIYDLFILMALCPKNCEYCKDQFTCDQPIKSLQVHLGCPDQTYYSYNQCLECSIGCQKCSEERKCLVCQEDYEKIGQKCYCKINNNMAKCQVNCHPICSFCSSYNESFQGKVELSQDYCVSCNLSEKKIANLQYCACIDGYYMNDNFQCDECGNKCKTCERFALVCTSCYPSQFRELNNKQCVCFEGYFENNISGECSQCIDKCQRCQYHNYYCTQCNINQFRIIKNYDCICQNGYYENGQICQKCNDLCEHCINQDKCISCYINQFRELNINDECICKQGYYDNNNQICQQCHYTCLECNQNQQFNQCINKCPQTRYKSNININNFECKCKQGYYDNGQQICINCLIYINPPTTHYCYTYCGDKIIQWNEQCDDGNNNQRDGCDQCYLNNQKCKSNICLKCYLGECQQCINGYYLNEDYTCQKCQQYCQLNRFNQCNQCINCQINNGYIIKEDKCISICGDGIKTDNEECDDGNILNNDGCNQYCQIENEYQCYDICEKIQYIEMIIKEDQNYKYYDNQRNIYLTFDQKVKISNGNLNESISIIPQFNDFEIQKFNVIDKTIYNSEFNFIDLQIQIQLTKSIILPQIQIIIQDVNITIQNEFNYSLSKFNQSIKLSSYYQLSESQINNISRTIEFTTFILYILIGLSLVKMFYRKIHSTWGYLQFLQTFSYLRYINVDFPYVLVVFSKQFQFTEFIFLNQLFQQSNQSMFKEFSLPQKLLENGYSPLILDNFITIFIIIFTFLGLNLILLVGKMLLKRSSFSFARALRKKMTLLKIDLLLIINQPFNLFIFLQLFVVTTNMNGAFILNYTAAVLLLIFEIGQILIFLRLSNRKRKNNLLSYISNLRYQVLNQLLFNIFFIFFGFSLFNNPLFHILIVSMTYFFKLMLVLNSYMNQKYHNFISLLQSILLWVVTLLIIFIVVVQQTNKNNVQLCEFLGWSIVLTVTIMILLFLLEEILNIIRKMKENKFVQLFRLFSDNRKAYVEIENSSKQSSPKRTLQVTTEK